MIKLYCDFNDRTEDDLYWLLFVEGVPLEVVIQAIGLKDGDRVILFQDIGDFEVEATLHFDSVHPNFFGTKVCVKPDWTTLRRL